MTRMAVPHLLLRLRLAVLHFAQSASFRLQSTYLAESSQHDECRPSREDGREGPRRRRLLAPAQSRAKMAIGAATSGARLERREPMNPIYEECSLEPDRPRRNEFEPAWTINLALFVI